MKLNPLTLGLGLSMTVSYGTLYYSFTLLAPRIAADFGWDKSFVFGVFSAGLLSGALAAPVMGRLVDRFGARIVMSIGSLMAALTLALFAGVQTGWQFIAVMLLSEWVALAVQYEAGFAALAKIHGQDAGKHITGVTLIAGFASTIFWPLIQFLLTHMDWRSVYLVLSGLMLVLTLPVHLLIPKTRLPVQAADPGEPPKLDTGLPLSKREQRLVMLMMAVLFSGTGFLMSAVNSSIMLLLSSMGFAATTATFVGAMIGPSQVFARLLNFIKGASLTPVRLAIVSVSALALALVCLMLTIFEPVLLLAAIFAIFYGVGQGLSSIVKGTLPLQFFGARDYGRITGSLASARLVLTAAAPVSTVFVFEHGSTLATLALLLAVTLASLASAFGLVLLSRDIEARMISAERRP